MSRSTRLERWSIATGIDGCDAAQRAALARRGITTCCRLHCLWLLGLHFGVERVFGYLVSLDSIVQLFPAIIDVVSLYTAVAASWASLNAWVRSWLASFSAVPLSSALRASARRSSLLTFFSVAVVDRICLHPRNLIVELCSPLRRSCKLPR